jgi:phosphate uptake regulator
LSLIARQQPAVRDLRFIVAAINIVLDLERIADRVTNSCERVVFVATGRMEEISSEPGPNI